jgi:putative DNA primase/helicase
MVTTTSYGGANSAAKTDWSPLKGRKVFIWPDADEPGGKYAKEVAQRLSEIGCEVFVIDSMSLASIRPAGDTRKVIDGWDAADAVEEWRDRKALRTTIKGLLKRNDPGPAYMSYGPYEMTDKGLTVEKPAGNAAGASKRVRISSAFEVAAKSRDAKGKNWGKWIQFADGDGRIHHRHVPDADMQGDNPAAVCSPLAHEGLSIAAGQQRQLVSYLAGVKSNRRGTVVERTGWHEVGGHRCFVLPQETIGPRGAEIIILADAAVGPYDARGTLNDWQQSVGSNSGEHFLTRLAVSMAFAGPLLGLADQEGGGLNFYSTSSTGKTTLARLAASVWGRGSSNGYMRGWRATANGLEGAAASSTDTLLVLDEIGAVDAAEAGPAIYELANGAGKLRAKRDATLRDTKTWLVLVLSTGEVPMATKIAEDRGKRARAGQAVRLLDIPADRSLGFGVFSHVGSEADAGELAEKFELEAVTNYGTAGPAFIRKVIDEGVDEVRKSARGWIKKFIAENAAAGSDGQVRRAARRLGLIAAAGEIATTLGILPWKAGQSMTSARYMFRRWLEQRGGSEPAEVQQAIRQVRQFIEQFGDSRFDPLPVNASSDRPVINRAGWRAGSGPNATWYVLPEVWRSEVCGGLDWKFAAKILGERKILQRGSDGWQKMMNMGGTERMRFYCITSRIFAQGQEPVR